MYCIRPPSGSIDFNPLIDIVSPGKALISSPALALGDWLFFFSLLLFFRTFLSCAYVALDKIINTIKRIILYYLVPQDDKPYQHHN